MSGAIGSIVGGAAGFMLGGPAGAAVGASLGSGFDSRNAASQAADAQTQAAQAANNTQLEMFYQNRADQEPWRQAGQNALTRLGGMYRLPGYEAYDFTADPGYQFRLDEGEKAINRSAGARGLLQSGRTVKDLIRFNQGMASQEYGNVTNRLAALSGVGQTSAQAMGNQATLTGQSIGNNILGAGNARASGYVGGANALGAGISNAGNIYMQNQLLQRLGGYGNPNVYGAGGGGTVPTSVNWDIG